MLVDAGSSGQHRPDLMERACRAAAAVAAGYVLAFSVAGGHGESWYLAAIVASGILAATASLRALPNKLRLVLGAASTALFAVLGILGIPVTVGLLIGAFLLGGGTMSLFDSRADPLGDIRHAD
ncbi:MAG: hypothetical protein H0U52_06110 [Chloroflexi bacterium]|nr:hypothetical protein [Chloroflexota bacterium]